MGTAMMFYFVSLHIVLVPAWVVNFNKSRQITLLHRGNRASETSASSFPSQQNSCCWVRISWRNLFPATCAATNTNSKLSTRTLVLLVTFAAALMIAYGLQNMIETNFGIPSLFEKGSNISILLFIAKTFKSNILTVSPAGHHMESPATDMPSARPSVDPSFYPTPSNGPSFRPTPTLDKSLAPTTSKPPQWPGTKTTAYTVHFCSGVKAQKISIDSKVTSIVDHETFGSYALDGLMEDMVSFCKYLRYHKHSLDATLSGGECIYNELLSVSSQNISTFDRIYLWMAQRKNRYYQVGVVPAKSEAGNFGNKGMFLTWLCQSVPCVANVSSFYDRPKHAMEVARRWNQAIQCMRKATSMEVKILVGSEAWMFPFLSNALVSSILVSSTISLLGSLVIIYLFTLNLKQSLLVGVSITVLLAASILQHALIFSEVIDLIDIVVLISFVGIIVDYPLHMSFYSDYATGLYLEAAEATTATISATNDAFIDDGVRHMRKTLLGPAITTIAAASPLLFARFTLISKAGEYIIILCSCTYAYVALCMPFYLHLIPSKKASAASFPKCPSFCHCRSYSYNNMGA